MKLSKCIELAKFCGLSTLGEAYDNITIHCTSLFVWNQIEVELQELRNEIGKTYNLKVINTNIDSILI